MPEPESNESLIDYLYKNSEEIFAQLGNYGYLIGDTLFYIAAGILTVFLLQKLSSKLLYPRMKNKRVLTVTFFGLYLMVLVVTGLLVLDHLGFDVTQGGTIAIVAVLLLTVVLYFLLPFIPRLPFMPGHIIMALGEMGIVEQISTFHTTVRKFDDTLVFLPNAMMMASKILNYSYMPGRRIEMKISLSADSDLKTVKARLLALAAGQERVQAEPAPAVYVTQAQASAIDVSLFCWVSNSDYMGALSDLWTDLVQLSQGDSGICLSPDLHAVHLMDNR